MKKLGKLILVFTVLFYINSIAAQDKNNQWAVSFGNNAIDFHPVGTDSSDNATGHWFSEYFSVSRCYIDTYICFIASIKCYKKDKND